MSEKKETSVKATVVILSIAILLWIVGYTGWAIAVFFTLIGLIIHANVSKPKPNRDRVEKVPSQNDKIYSQPRTGRDYTFDYADADGVFTSRTIKVTNVNDRYIEGFCYLRGENRTFRRDRILTGAYSKAEERIDDVPIAYEDLKSLMIEKKEWLENLGWVVEHNFEGIGLHNKFKNGNTKKIPTVTLSDNFLNDHRPWSVKSPDMARAKTFSTLDRAAVLFLTKANSHKPI